MRKGKRRTKQSLCWVFWRRRKSRWRRWGRRCNDDVEEEEEEAGFVLGVLEEEEEEEGEVALGVLEEKQKEVGQAML